MEEAVRILEAAKERNHEWMNRLNENQKTPYVKKNRSIDEAIKKLLS